MAIKKGICKNYGECSLADERPVVVQEADSANFVCEECGAPLSECEKTSTGTGRGNKTKQIVLASLVGLAVLGGGGAYYFMSSDSAPMPEKVELAKETSNLVVGQTEQLKSVVLPEGVTSQLEWASSDESVVTVSDGVVTAVAPGKADVSVKVAGADGLTDVCAYTVDEKAAESEPAAKAKEETKTQTVSAPVRKVDLGYATFEGDIKNGKPHGNGTMSFKSRHLVPGTKDNYAEAGEQVIGAFRDGEINMGTLYQKNGNRVVVKHK